MINLSKIKQVLPPGLLDSGVEFLIHDNEIKCLHGGVIYVWGNFPEWIRSRIEQDMLDHPEAIQSLLDWDLRQSDEQMRQYIICRFGGFDNEPDISDSGTIDYTECTSSN